MPDNRMNLVAVQARTELPDYRDTAAFHAKMSSLMGEVARQADLSLPTLVSFPELIGIFLSFVPYYWDDLKDARLIEEAATRIVMRRFSELPESERTPERAARRLLFIDTAPDAEAAYTATFSELAREYGVYLAAGSIALPPMESEPSKGGRHVADAGRVYNTSYFFSPRGVCLRRVPKVYMTRGFEERLFDGAPKQELLPAETPLGRVGTLVCFDGFHDTLVEHYDSLGVQVLLKPSWNHEVWAGPCSYEPERREGENWLRNGYASLIQGRENIAYGVNAMLVGVVFEDLAAEGLSSIAANTGRVGASWEEGVIAMAAEPDQEEIIVATVERPGVDRH